MLPRLLLWRLERSIECETQTAAIQVLMQRALQYLAVEAHPSTNYIN